MRFDPMCSTWNISAVHSGSYGGAPGPLTLKRFGPARGILRSPMFHVEHFPAFAVFHVEPYRGFHSGFDRST